MNSGHISEMNFFNSFLREVELEEVNVLGSSILGTVRMRER